MKNKKMLTLLLALNSVASAYSNVNENIKYDKLFNKITNNINSSKSNNKSYKLIETILKKRNKELKDLQIQGDYIVKPEYLEWQIFYNAFYNNSDRGRGNNENAVNYTGNQEIKSINLGMVIPIKTVDKKDINLNVTSVTEPKVQFDVKPVSKIELGNIDIDYNKIELPEPPFVYMGSPITASPNSSLTTANSSSNIRYSTSGFYVFENLAVETIGKVSLIINNNTMDVNGEMKYANITAGVSGNSSSTPYQHTGLAGNGSIHTIGLNGNYEIKGDWDFKTYNSEFGFINYEPYYVTSDSKVTNSANLNLTGDSLSSPTLTGIFLRLKSQTPNNTAKVVFENTGKIVSNGGGKTNIITLGETYEDYLEGNIINKGIIEINNIPENGVMNLFGTGILITMTEKTTGKVLINPGNINVNGKYNSAIAFNNRYFDEVKAIDSNILIDGSDGIINVGGKSNVGILLTRTNGKINSNNGMENFKNLNLKLSGEDAVGLSRMTTSESENAKDIIIDSSLIKSISFGEDSKLSIFFQTFGSNLKIDSSMTDIFGTINSGTQNIIIRGVKNGDSKIKIVNNADITIGSGAKASIVMHGGGGELENTGNIRNDSSDYELNGVYSAGSISFLLSYPETTLKNTGNLVMNGNSATGIYNVGIVNSENDHIILNGNKGIIVYSSKTMGYDPSIGQNVWYLNENYISSNKIEINGNNGTVFSSEGSDFILSPKNLGGTLEITANGKETYGIYNFINTQKGIGKFIINGNVNMNIKNGGIAVGYQGDGSGATVDAAEYIRSMVDTSNGKFNINVDENSYKISFYATGVSLSGLSNLSNSDLTGVSFTGSNKSRLMYGTLYIDTDSNLDKNNITGDKSYRDMELNFSNLITNSDVTISGTEDSLFGMAQNGLVLQQIYLIPVNITNNGTVSLAGKDNIGVLGKRTTINNTGSINVTGDNGIGILGKSSKVVNDGQINIGNEGIGIYSETYLASTDDPGFENNSSIENAGSIISETGENAVGIYSVRNSAAGISSDNEIKLNSGTNIDLSKSKRGVGIYSDKSNVSGTGKITVGENGYGIYVKDADVNLDNLELNLFGDDSVGIYTDGTASFNGDGKINIDGKRVVIFNITSSGSFNQNFEISSAEGSTYVFQNIKNSEIFSNSTISLSEGGVYTYGINSAISLGSGSNMNSYNSKTDKYESNIIGIALSGGNFNGLPVILNGETLGQEATNKGNMLFGDNSAGIYVTDGASALNDGGTISLGKSSVGIYGKGTGTNVGNTGNITISDESIGLFLNDGLNITNTGNIESMGNKTVGIYSDTVNNSNIANTGDIKLSGDRTIGIYMTGAGSQQFKNTGNIITGFSSDALDPSIGIYNNTASGTLLNEGSVKVKENSIGIYNKNGTVKQTAGNIEAGENGMGIYSDSGNIQLNAGNIKLTGTNGIGIYGINGAKIDNNAKIDILNGNYGIVLQSDSELINRTSQTLESDGVFVYSDKASKVVNETGADLTMNGSRNVAFYMTNGGDLINNSPIIANTGEANIGIYNKEGSIENRGDIKIGDSIIIDPNDPYANSYSVAVYGEKTLNMKNSGNIELGKSGVGLYTRAGESEVLNIGNITSFSEGAIGIFADNSSVKNEGNINLSGVKSIGIAGERNAVISNSGIITMNGDESIGIYANSNSKVINTSTGIININGNNSTGIQLSDGSVLENYGNIVLANGITGSKDIVSGSSSYTPPSIINAGVIKVDEKFELEGLTLTIKVDPSTMRVPTLEEITLGAYDYEDMNSGFLLSNKTTIKAPSFDFGGNTVKIDPTFTQGTNARVYKFENVFDPNTPEGGQNTGIISLKSLSLSFDAIPVVNKTTGGVDIWMEKINYDKFTKGTWYNSFAENIESKYLNASGTALKLYDKLDMITSESDLKNSFEQLAGNIYSNITQREQEIAGTFKNTLEILQNSESNTKENVKISVIGGKGKTKEETNGVLNYDYKTTGVMALREIERTYKHKFGYSLGYTRTDFEFDNIKDKDRADTVQIGLHNKYNTGNWEIKNFLLGRVSFHDVDRTVNWYDGSSSELNSDYNVYGISSFNEIGKRIDLNNTLKVIPYAGLELAYTAHSNFEENGSAEKLKIDSNDTYSIKPGIGVRLEGEKEFGNTSSWKLKGNIGVGYEYELGNMNKQEKASLLLIEDNYHELAKAAEEKGKIKTSGHIGVELKEKYGVYITGEYKSGSSDKEDYRAGIVLKAAF